MNELGIFILVLFYIAGIVVIAGNILALLKCLPIPFFGNFVESILYSIQLTLPGRIIYIVLLVGIGLTIPYVIGILTAITAEVF